MNIYRGDDGKWKSYVYVRREENPELVSVVDRNPKAIEESPDTRFWKDPFGRLRLLDDGQPPPRGEVVLGGSYTLYTRIYLGVVPPKGYQPGYCAVLGEKFDRSFEPHPRPLFQLDEGVCFPDVDPSMALIHDLLAATCALKDLYLPAHEKPNSTSLGGDRRLIVNPGHEQFYQELIQQKHGICTYPGEDEVQDAQLEAKHPFFASRDRTGPLYEPPYREDEDYGRKVVESLVNRVGDDGEPMLKHHSCCEVLKTGQYVTPLQAQALCCLSLQTYDWVEVLEGRFDYDGYEIDETPKQEKWERRLEMEREHMLNGILYMASDLRDKALLENEGLKGYRKAVGVDFELGAET